MDRLIDILIEIPGLLEMIDKMKEMEGRDVNDELLEKLRVELSRLNELLQQWHTSFQELLVEPVRDAHQCGLHDPARAHITVIYWLTNLRLWDALAHSPVDLDSVEETIDPLMCASTILKILPSLLSAESGLFGNHIAAFPLGVAMKYLRTSATGGEVVKHMEEFLQSAQMRDILKFISSLSSAGPSKS